jgi:2-polyprenyl-3-methyl-5-hydroxy-6-metoxy-1,4-benzoquinol methylase
MSEETNCNLCGSDKYRAKVRYTWFLDMTEPYQVCECADCGLIYLNPRPTPEELVELYAREPYFSKENADRGASRTDFYTDRMRRLESAAPKKGRLLGIGCLEGGYALEIAQNLGWDVTGVESSNILASYAREHLSIDVETVHSWDLSGLPSDSFDAVYTHSFEHFGNPSDMLRQCFRVLKPSGTIMIEVPNQFYSLKDKVRKTAMELLGEHRYRVFSKPPPLHFHLYYYSHRTISQMLESQHFSIRELKTYIPWHPVYHRNQNGKWLQEGLYALGGLVGRGPSLEVVASVEKKIV